MDKKTIDLKKLPKSSVDSATQAITGNDADVQWTVRFAAGTKVGGKTKRPRS